MPRRVLEFRVVVASPSDVFETRKAVFDTIYDLNRALEVQGISIRGLGWEEYATPGISDHAQSVINDQLLREYDILVAILGTRLGTPTAGAASGTVEEIEHAIANSSSAMRNYRVQVYFLDTVESLSSISPGELMRVAEFRKSLEQRGVLYHLFKNKDELQREIRTNIQRPILEFLRSNGGSDSGLPSTILSQAVSNVTQTAIEIGYDDGEEVGLLDQQEKAEEAIEIANISLESINGLMEEIAAQTNRQVSEMEKSTFFGLPAREKKAAVNHFASFLKSKADNLKEEARSGRENFNRYSSALIALARLERSDGNDEQYSKGLEEILKTAESILSSLPDIRRATTGFKSAVESLPRITIQFNQSKRLLIEAIDECILLFDETERCIYEIADRT